ncbi:MAG: sigma 54-interacting transcriptional regulator [Firmicutes bacterium]|nr:sigma 54-interacting transcriptional regulator [Bacillota bacterium]
MYIDKLCREKDGYLEFAGDRIDCQFENILTCNPSMMEQLERIRKIAGSDASVIIFGETGTGKELYAEYIHQMSSRCHKRYIKINCATISESLFESEMFGYMPGSFTGALKNGKQGIFEIANGGTVFLDEISEMSMSIQSKFLRAIQEKSFVKVGSGTETAVDLRFVAASNRELEGMIEDGSFREDLYYRLNVIPIRLLPLRERKEDIVLLTLSFTEQFNRAYGLNRKVTRKLMESFLEYDWPGNVRELKNAVERAVLLNSGDLLTHVDLRHSSQPRIVNTAGDRDIGKADFAEEIFDSGKSLKEMVSEYEKHLIEKYIEKYGSLRKAAKALQTSPASLSRKMSGSGDGGEE